MRNLLLVLAASSLLPACLSDPAERLYSRLSDREAAQDEKYDDGDSLDGFTEKPSVLVQEPYATSAFSFDGLLVAKENVQDDEDENEDEGEYEDELNEFGPQNLSLYCVESAMAQEPIGYIRVSIEEFLPSQKDAVMSWQQRIEVPCAGKIDFEYRELFAGHHYIVKIDHLDLESKIVKTSTGNFSVPEEHSGPIPFELK